MYYEIYEEDRWISGDRKFFKDLESAKKYKRKFQRRLNSLSHKFKVCIREISEEELRQIATEQELLELFSDENL